MKRNIITFLLLAIIVFVGCFLLRDVAVSSVNFCENNLARAIVDGIFEIFKQIWS